jgi:hypothetical protein
MPLAMRQPIATNAEESRARSQNLRAVDAPDVAGIAGATAEDH